VQALPSSQGAVLGVNRHPDAGSQVSSVQGFPSSQVTGFDPMQDPSWHWSVRVQADPSSQGRVFGT